MIIKYLLGKMVKRLKRLSITKLGTLAKAADRFASHLGSGLLGRKEYMFQKDIQIDLNSKNDDTSYFSIEHDKINLRNDFLRFKADFAHSTKEARKKLEYGEAVASK